MKPYSEYSAKELAMERLFIRWVRNPNDPHVRKFWVNWVQDNPQRAETVESAKMLVDTVSDWEETEISKGEVQSLWNLIRYSILGSTEQSSPSVSGLAPTGNWSFLKWSMGIGATVVVLLFLFLRDAPLYPDETESHNALVPPFSKGGLSRADSIESLSNPDSAQNSKPKK